MNKTPKSGQGFGGFKMSKYILDFKIKLINIQTAFINDFFYFST